MYQPILEALRDGSAEDALAAAREAVAAQPLDPNTHRLLAAALRQTGDRDGAMAAIDTAIGLVPDEAGLHLERAGLLLEVSALDEVQAEVARSIGLDPSRFPAYIVQAQLAIARGDLDEAERLSRTASRIAPEHPQVAAVEGTIALRRGEVDRALKLLARAAERAPGEPQIRHALGFAYLAKGHNAFAEQAFRRVLAMGGESIALRVLIADIVRRQGRTAEAADELATLLDDPAAPASVCRQVGELELEAGRDERAAAPLLRALQQAPGDRRTLTALLETWRRLGRNDEARATLDALTLRHPELGDLWLARLGLEVFASPEAAAVLDRWLAAVPEHVPAMIARSVILDANGDTDAGEALALRVTEIEPGHVQAELRVLEGLLGRDPDAAVWRVQDMLDRALNPSAQRNLRQLLARTLERAGRPAEAAELWLSLHAEIASSGVPLPVPTQSPDIWPAFGPLPPSPPATLLLWGPPGSLVERLAVTFEYARAPLRTDRFGPNPPSDAFQHPATPQRLREGELDPRQMMEIWRAGLEKRGVRDGQIADWLPAWDNAYLLALRPHLPEAMLMVALRDPRDMLIDWLAHGSPAPFVLESLEAGAQWLAAMMAQLVEIMERKLYSYRVLKLDENADDPVALANAIGAALQITVPPPPAQALGPARIFPGRWRGFAAVMPEPFALLTPWAVRLGYSES